MSQHFSLADQLATERFRAQHQPAGRARSMSTQPRAGAARTQIGWLLVGLGLKLALPRHGAASGQARLAGR